MKKNNKDEFLSLANNSKTIINNSAVFSALESLLEWCKKGENPIILVFNEKTILCFDRLKFLNFCSENIKANKTNQFKLMSSENYECAHYDFHNESSLACLGNRIAKGTNMEYVWVYSNMVNLLYYKGIICEDYDNYLDNSKRIRDLSDKYKTLDDLGIAFLDYRRTRFDRKDKNITINGYVNEKITEHILRNDLFNYLKKNFFANVTLEPCTNKENDEESADIAIVDIENKVALIEVKFIIFRGGFCDSTKYKYGLYRFSDGYEQIDKYCVNYSKFAKLYSVYLYMFYAGMSPSEIKINQHTLYNNFLKSSSEDFKKYYCMTFLDNLIDRDIPFRMCDGTVD